MNYLSHTGTLENTLGVGCSYEMATFRPLDSKYCVRHTEKNHYWAEKHSISIPKKENKHFHVSKGSLIRNKDFNSSEIEVCLDHTLTVAAKQFLLERF